MTEQMIKYCPRCRTANPQNADYCMRCGYDFIDFVLDFFKTITQDEQDKKKE